MPVTCSMRYRTRVMSDLTRGKCHLTRGISSRTRGIADRPRGIAHLSRLMSHLTRGAWLQVGVRVPGHERAGLQGARSVPRTQRPTFPRRQHHGRPSPR
eukprot:3758306-Rhodomonas_salina.1